MRAPDYGHSSGAIFPDFPSPAGHFRREQSGTDLETQVTGPIIGAIGQATFPL